MLVRRYVVDSMPDALQRISSELGKDAVIIKTQPIRSGGFLGLFQKKRIEVIAAIDSNETAQTRHRSVEKTSQPTVVPKKEMSVMVEATSAVAAPVVEREVHFAPEQQLQKEAELYELKQLMMKMVVSKDQKDPVHPALAQMGQRLRDQEVEEKYIMEVMEGVMKELPLEDLDDEKKVLRETQKLVTQWLQESITTSLTIQPHIRFVHIIGPTGVGKTTTIAKIAAKNMMEHQRNVGLITSDTYRVAAVDQLRTYANIMSIPMEVVFSAEEIAQALDRLKDCDLIIMDTAGRNYRDQKYVEEIKKLLNITMAKETYLVMSLSSKYSDMKKVLANFKQVDIDKILFTKADETGSYGLILNIVKEYKLSLSYFTNGQNVPKDIAIAEPSVIANLMLGVEGNV